MRVYQCPVCGARVWFDNLTCVCGTVVAYSADEDAMMAGVSFCANRSAIGCNWVADPSAALCRSCAMTRTHPDLAIPENSALWARAEGAKRWVIANLTRLGWFGDSDPGSRPAFDMLSEETSDGSTKTVMGHADGLITINVSEADPAEIVLRRERMEERYRTMLGHLRHEIAHFLFLRLSQDRPEFIGAFRTLFGDERVDYGAALARHYAQPDDSAWRGVYISHYASAHPHEDWAETASHAMHLTDFLDSGRALGFAGTGDGDDLGSAMALGIAVNHLNRSMGMEDVYPFVVSDEVRRKLSFAAAAIDRRRG